MIEENWYHNCMKLFQPVTKAVTHVQVKAPRTVMVTALMDISTITEHVPVNKTFLASIWNLEGAN